MNTLNEYIMVKGKKKVQKLRFELNIYIIIISPLLFDQ